MSQVQAFAKAEKGGSLAKTVEKSADVSSPTFTVARRRASARLHAAAMDFYQEGRLDDAVDAYGQALVANPANWGAYNDLGLVLKAQKKNAAAISCFKRALAFNPKSTDAYSNIGDTLRIMDNLEESLAAHQVAVRLAPDRINYLLNMGLTLGELGRWEEALTCYDKALKKSPDHVGARYTLSLTLLAMGRFEEGFFQYKVRWRREDRQLPKISQPQWDGSNLKGKTVLVIHEQGFGDSIQFVRYAPMIKDRGGRVILQCKPELARLFSSVPGIDRIVVGDLIRPHFDYFIPMLDLPLVFGAEMENIPAKVPYLSVSFKSPLRLCAPDNYLKVGICWSGSLTHKNDYRRSCPFSYFVELMGEPGVSFFSLQVGERTSDPEEQACPALVQDVGRQMTDFADTAAILSALDLVITVDTSLSHLAGAMGYPTWVLLPYIGDWRWLQKRNDSPWYPTIRLFRQDFAGDWDGVFVKVRDALKKAVKSKRRKAASR